MNYEPLIERDLEAIPAAARAFLESHSEADLWISVARFAVLAYAPSQHAKRAVMACRAAHGVRDEMGDRWTDMVIECARYAAEARQPWSEPPILDPPEPSRDDLEELREAIREGDRLRAERWLAACLGDAEARLREVVRGDALLMLDAAAALLALLGEKGRYTLLRMPVWELVAGDDDPGDDLPVDTLLARAVEQNGSIDTVRAVFLAIARRPGVGAGDRGAPASGPRLDPYPLARDYAQTLIAHDYARRLPREQAERLLHAVHHNLVHGESYADWSFA